MAEQLPEGTDTIITGAGVDNDQDGDTTTSTRYAGNDAASSGQTGAASSGESRGAETGGTDAGGLEGGTFFDRIEQFRSQGYDKAREYAVTGKDRATDALDDLLQTINDAAGQIDSKIGSQYGDYARKAAESLSGFNDALKGKDVDDLFNDARALIAKAPAVTVGTAAVLGFVVARLAKAGLNTDALTSTDKA